jgi:XTP/dITP diphosphohydrolase
MSTDLSTSTLVIATGNPGKLHEFQARLKPLGWSVTAQTDLGVTEVEETGLSFVENALIKGRHASAVTGLPALADDSGLAVDALGGEPGIYSARYAGVDASDQDNNERLLNALRNVPAEHRVARFHCALALVKHASDPTPLIIQASWQGHILSEPRGVGGFGYDPLFYLHQYDCSSAELDPETKNRLSHRGQAVTALVAALANDHS